MKTTESYYIVNVHILTDSWGEWWEHVKHDGSTSRWEAGTSEFKKDKEFKTPEAAKTYATNKGLQHFQVCRLDPPESIRLRERGLLPDTRKGASAAERAATMSGICITWKNTVIFEHNPVSAT